ncbi:DUF5994 family protein [Actinoplanes sp. NPDC049265]|uniref:DUF5994 family protein n=1 Tax=Actinoplanes sp. NPDC049265 TaxID=3363902 RepID=UPI003711F73D
MASLHHIPDSPPATDPPRVWLEPVRDHHLLLDGSWWPGPDDLGAELKALLPVLDRVRGPVVRVLLSAAGWTSRPHHVVVGDRTVSIGYFSDQPPSMMTVLCRDGGTFMMRVAPSSRTADDAPSTPDPFTARASG